jgi:hypothetical protein
MAAANGYFDIERDIAKEKRGGFFCHACLAGHQKARRSPDPRYCQGCYDFLVKEAEILPKTRRPKWIPKAPQKASAPRKPHKKQYQIPQHGGRIVSTLESKKFTVDIIHPATRKVTGRKRGPKHRELPEDLIRQLAAEGMGSKAISAWLRAEHGLTVSYRTIQRILSGQRVLVC